MTPVLKNILLLIGLAIVLGAAYYMYSNGNLAPLDVSTVDSNQELLNKTAEFINRREQLNSTTLDLSLFSDARFNSLRSFSTPVPDQTVGRVNIFDKPATISSTRVSPPQ